jgi:hypothetical protein
LRLDEKYSDSKIIHFIEMYDNVIGLEAHALNAIIFEGEEYIEEILKEIKFIEENGDSDMILNHLKNCYWTKDNERSIQRIKNELLLALKLK